MHLKGVHLLALAVGTVVGCHRAPPSVGPSNLRTAAECAAVIDEVRADTSLDTAPRASVRKMFLPPLPPPERARGVTAQLWVPVDERGRVRASAVRVTGMPDAEYARRLQAVAALTEWTRPVRNGCWVPGWGYLTYSFPR
jgi:hypothetical protein